MKQFFYPFILIAFIAFTTETVQAQGKRNIGIRAGYQISGLFEGSDRLAGTSNYGGFYAGAFKEKKIIPFLHWGVGLEFCKNGAELADNSRQVINYLGVPVYLKAKVGPVYALLGVQPKVKIGEKIIINDETTNPTDEQKSKTFDLPAFGGLGVNILIVSLEARYHYSMIETNHGARNAYLQFGATLHF
jgi:hypothetical protein